MKTMKTKRWLSVLLCMLLCVCMAPTTAFAASWPPQLYVNGVDILSAENNTVVCGDGTAVYDSENNILTLDNATITNEYNNNYGIYARDMNLNIVLVGTNSISATNQGIYMANSSGGSAVDDGYLSISGSGSIKITAGIYPIYGYKGVTISGGNINCEGSRAISTEGSVKIENSSITGTCTDNSEEDYGVAATQDIIITGSTVHMQGYWGGINSIFSGVSINGGSEVTVKETTGNAVNTRLLTVDGSTLKADNIGAGAAVYSAGNITFKNSNAEISSVSSNGLYADGTIIIEEESEMTAIGSGLGIYGGTGVSVTDSNVTAQAEGSVALYSPSNVTIETSIVDATAPERSEWYKGRRWLFVSGSWISTTGNEDFGSNIKDSVLINGSTGKVIGSHTLLADTTISRDITLEFTEGSSLTVPSGVSLTNNGVITGDINITNNGTVICNSHAGGTATCTERAVCAICGERYGELLAHELTLTEKVDATSTTDGKEAY